MKPSIVVDVGNSRIKWGLCAEGPQRSALSTQYCSLPADDPAAWEAQLMEWRMAGPLRWAMCGVHPERLARLAEWARRRGDAVWVLEDWRDVPLDVRLEHPGRVGIDRLLDAVAAKSRQPSGTPAAIVDAGSAVTVDWLDESGAFRGGSIFPGLRLMAHSLHDYTALLPLVEVKTACPEVPATSTPAAVEAGVFWAVVGGIRAVVERLAVGSAAPPGLYLTGGDAALLRPALDARFIHWPAMTLDGLRITAEAKP